MSPESAPEGGDGTGGGPLAGLLVVSVEQAVAAPLCTARLVDAGARVIKIERAGGDFARGYDTAAAGDSSYFAWINHGKESIVLDFKREDDAALLHELCDRADVFVQNLAHGAAARAGFGADTLRRRNPRLITCDISGYGSDTPLATRKAYDLLIQAESGLVGISGGPGELGRIGVSLCDIATGITAHAAILEALIGRGMTGRGAALELSLFDVAAEWMTVPLVQEWHGSGGPTREGLRHPSIAPYGAYRSGDDKLTLVSIQNEREWQRLCVDVLDDPAMASDPLFATNTDRVANREALEQRIQTIVGSTRSETFRSALADASIAFGSINATSDLLGHPALRVRTIATSNGTEIGMPRHPARVGDDKKVPNIDEHGPAIRAEFGGR